MRIVKPWGQRLLAAYLILAGLSALIPIIPGIILALVALAAGILILIGR